MSDNTATLARSLLSLVFGALAVFFVLCAAVAIAKGLGSPLVIAIELLIAALFTALFAKTGRR